MVKSISKVVYKPNSQSTDEYIAIVNPEEYKKWLEDKSVPLVEVVECKSSFTPHAPLSSTNVVYHSAPPPSSRAAFDIYHSGQGAQGYLGKASKQEIAAAFDASNETDALEILLAKGSLQSGDSLKQFSDTNDRRGARITSAGAVGGGR